jgi:hypothetical protein
MRRKIFEDVESSHREMNVRGISDALPKWKGCKLRRCAKRDKREILIVKGGCRDMSTRRFDHE